MWARQFWDGDDSDPLHRHACPRSMRLGFAVHDEARIESIVDMHPMEAVIADRRHGAGRNAAAAHHALVHRFHETDLLWRIPSVAPHVVS